MTDEAGPQSNLRKKEQVLTSFLDQLDAASEKGGQSSARRSERFTYRVMSLTVELPQPGNSTPTTYTVPSRNISREGVGFLFGRFVYPGSTCRVRLVNVHKHEVFVAGKVVRCRYLQGSANLHEVGVKFDRPIDVEMFHSGATRIRILLADDDPTMHKLVGALLKPLNVDLTCATDGHQAVEMASSAFFDLVLMDMEMPELDGLAATKELRGRGYTRPIVALTARGGDETEKDCREAGCQSCLSKPVTRDTLVGVIDSIKAEPLVSSLMHETDMVELIDEFVNGLPEKVEQLEAALSSQDMDAVERTARLLKGEAGAFGFQVITDAAQYLEDALLNKANADDIRVKLMDLSRLCMAARPASCSQSSG